MLFLHWEHQSILWWYRQLSLPALSSFICCLCPCLFTYQILSTSGCPVCLHTGTIHFSRLCTKPILFLSSEGKHASSHTKQTRPCCLTIGNIFFMDMHGLVHSWSLRYKVVSQNKDPALPAALGRPSWSLLFWTFYLFTGSKYSINTWWQY